MRSAWLSLLVTCGLSRFWVVGGAFLFLRVLEPFPRVASRRKDSFLDTKFVILLRFAFARLNGEIYRNASTIKR